MKLSEMGETIQLNMSLKKMLLLHISKKNHLLLINVGLRFVIFLTVGSSLKQSFLQMALGTGVDFLPVRLAQH